jgi:NAD(P)H-hydrate epimerase
MESLTREEVRDVDRRAVAEFGMLGVVLMENAGRGAADLLLGLGVAGRVSCLCGKGNNGGDGLVIARHLEAAGLLVQVWLACDPDELDGDAAANMAILRAAGTPWQVLEREGSGCLMTSLSESVWVVDALLGTGLQGDVRAPYREWIETVNACGRPVLAVDLPSGLDCDSGLPWGIAVRATRTATFVASKRGFANPAAREWTGEVTVLPIGVPRSLLAAYNFF